MIARKGGIVDWLVKDASDRADKAFQFRRCRRAIPFREVCGLDLSEAIRRVDLLKKGREEDAAVRCFLSLVLYPVGCHGRARPEDYDSLGARKLLNDYVRIFLAGWNYFIPPHRPLLLLTYAGQTFSLVPILARIADENITHEFLAR